MKKPISNSLLLSEKDSTISSFIFPAIKLARISNFFIKFPLKHKTGSVLMSSGSQQGQSHNFSKVFILLFVSENIDIKSHRVP